MATVKKFEELNSVKKLLSGQNHILIITKKNNQFELVHVLKNSKLKLSSLPQT